MKKIFYLCITILFSCQAMASDITGYWTTIDDETQQPKSVVQIYKYQNKYYGRIVEIFNNKEAVAKLTNSPRILGLDIIWDLEKKDEKYKNGSILDPQKGKVYGLEAWKDGENLIIRGKIAFLGRNQTWLKNTTFTPNEEQTLVPKIIKP